MNLNTAKTTIASLSSGTYAGRDWLNSGEARVYFRNGYERDVVADFGLHTLYNSGRQVEESVTVTDKQLLRALRRMDRG